MFALHGCLSIDDPTVGPDGAVAGVGGAGSGGATGHDGSSDAMEDTVSDAASDVNGDGPSGAGDVSCGTATCSLADGFCCHRYGGYQNACKSAGSACWGQKIECDGGEDCPGKVCCLGSNGVSCATSCSSVAPYGVVQVCKTDTECPAPTTCQPVSGAWTLPADYATCR